ncbi:ribosomal protein S6 kinase alpha-3-like isoform X1 [Zootermopsis nevadensis]|nr:ribosomal protein S6 kinase alpha-3-like isoform X1 [Zootermopsis nevadensis]
MASLSIENSIVVFPYHSKQTAFRFYSNRCDCYSPNMARMRRMFFSIQKRIKKVNLKNLRVLNHGLKVESRKRLLADRARLEAEVEHLQVELKAKNCVINYKESQLICVAALEEQAEQLAQTIRTMMSEDERIRKQFQYLSMRLEANENEIEVLQSGVAELKDLLLRTHAILKNKELRIKLLEEAQNEMASKDCELRVYEEEMHGLIRKLVKAEEMVATKDKLIERLLYNLNVVFEHNNDLINHYFQVCDRLEVLEAQHCHKEKIRCSKGTSFASTNADHGRNAEDNLLAKRLPSYVYTRRTLKEYSDDPNGPQGNEQEAEQAHSNQPINAPSVARAEPSQYHTATLDDFKNLRDLGSGGYGAVFLVEKNGGIDHRRLYAMKTLQKKEIFETLKGPEMFITECLVHEKARGSPFLVKLYYRFCTNETIYLLLEYYPGGDMLDLLMQLDTISEDEARVYLAEVILAIEHLHRIGIIHRDIKPENILIDARGHIAVTDYGLCKQMIYAKADRTDSFCGTKAYMAPEMVTSGGHGMEVDWWAVGILAYEMLAGRTPFVIQGEEEEEDKKKISLMVRICSEDPVIPDEFLPDVAHLVTRLLEKDPQKRLGAGNEGAAAIKRHQFFHGINWASVEQKAIDMPYLPRVNDKAHVDAVQDIPESDRFTKNEKFTLKRQERLCDCTTPAPGCHLHAHSRSEQVECPGQADNGDRVMPINGDVRDEGLQTVETQSSGKEEGNIETNNYIINSSPRQL